MSAARELTADDLAQLTAAGIDAGEAARQLALLRQPPPPARLVRPCVPGDGILRVAPEREPALRARVAGARAVGRLAKLVPASGAASRMFKELLAWCRGGDDLAATAADGESTGAARAFFADLDRFAFRGELAAELERHGDDLDRALAAGRHRDVLAALLEPERLDYAALPKALLLFHQYDGGPRTPFAEHLVESARLLRDELDTCRVHFTIPEDRRADFEHHLAVDRSWIEPRLRAQLEVSFSTQDPATDTLAIAPDGAPFRREDGTLLLRPGGHGSLLRNLDRLGADLVFIKNIDNVVREEQLAETLRWRELLAGVLLELETELHAHQRRLSAADASPVELADAHRFLVERLGEETPAALERGALLARLTRPLRVCGMVLNEGEPGGGPFWVRGADGQLTRQIVETSQVDLDDPEQVAVLRASTHFNPTDLVCSVRDAAGEPYTLARFVDPAAAFVTRKSEAGRELLALEHPGLWNGAMAGWISVFVEIHVDCFAPVKSVLDLLRPEHQPPPLPAGR